MGLDDSRFGNISTNVIGLDLLPSLGEIYNKMTREEQRLASTRSGDQQQEAVGFVARQNTNPSRRDAPNDSSSSRGDNSIMRPRVICSHCGRTGHEKKDCWQLVGFPDWFNDRSGGRGQGNGNRGRGCGMNTRGRGQANVAQATSSNSSFSELTSDQWKILSQMIQEKSGNSASDKLSGKNKIGDVIFDTGASHHMTGSRELLTDMEMIPPCSISFADGNRTFAVKMGTLSLFDTIKLQRVLYVPDLNCTLVSVAKLVKQANCFATFTDTICVLQDHFSRTLIGAGEESDGVYYFTDLVSVKSHQLVFLIMLCGINAWVIRRFRCFQIYLLFLNQLAQVLATLVLEVSKLVNFFMKV